MRVETAMRTERSADKLTTWQPETQPSVILGWLVEQLTVLAEAMGETMTAARLKIYAADLADIEGAALAVAFQRARRECRFFPKIAELRELAGVGRAEQQDAEARRAWDELTKFVRKYVGNDVHSNFCPEHGSYSNFPKLCDRILDTVRRTGGWKVYACMTDDDFPFMQKRFFAEYEAWSAVERIELPELISQMPQLHLVAKPMEPRKVMPAPMVPQVRIKKIPEPLTDAQLRDRREMLRQQRDKLQK
jgi:hypothetical protein